MMYKLVFFHPGRFGKKVAIIECNTKMHHRVEEETRALYHVNSDWKLEKIEQTFDSDKPGMRQMPG